MTGKQQTRQCRHVSKLLKEANLPGKTKPERVTILKCHDLLLQPPTLEEIEKAFDSCWKGIELLDSMVRHGIPHDRWLQIQDECLELHTHIIDGNLSSRFVGDGQRSGLHFYCKWLGGIMVETYVRHVIVPALWRVPCEVIRSGTDDVKRPEKFRRTHRADLTALVDSGYRFEIQHSASGEKDKRDLKADKIREAAKAKTETALLFIDTANGCAACLRDIGRLVNAPFQKRAAYGNKKVWPIPDSYIVWKLDESPPLFCQWPVAGSLG